GRARIVPHLAEAGSVAGTDHRGAASALHGQRRQAEDPIRAVARRGARSQPGASAARPGACARVRRCDAGDQSASRAGKPFEGLLTDETISTEPPGRALTLEPQ